MRIEGDCLVCGKHWQGWYTPSHAARGDPPKKYCSAKCWAAVYLTSDHQRAIGAASRERRAAAMRDKYRGGTKPTYRKFNGRHEHRVIMEQALGRALTSSEIIHHIDGNHRNNARENLELTTRAEHARHHFALHRKPPVTHCLRGHEYNKVNTAWDRNSKHRTCKACRRERWQARKGGDA